MQIGTYGSHLSQRAGYNDACCRRAFLVARFARKLLDRPLQKLAFGRPDLQRARPRMPLNPDEVQAYASDVETALKARVDVGPVCEQVETRIQVERAVGLS